MENNLYSWGNPGTFSQEVGMYCLGIYILVVFVIFIFMDIFSKKIRIQFVHRYASVALCGLFGFLYPVIQGKVPFWCVGLLCGTVIGLARYLWVIDGRRHKENEELWAVLSSQNFDTVKSHLNTNRNINLTVTDIDGKTPVDIALQCENEKMLELLLTRGASFTGGNLLEAISKNFVGVVDLMIDRGGEINPLNYTSILNTTPLECAVRNNCLEITKQLLKKGALFNFCGNSSVDEEKKHSELFLSISNKYDEMTELLLENGAYGQQALLLAIQKNLVDVAKKIIDNMPLDQNIFSSLNLIISNQYEEKYVLLLLSKMQDTFLKQYVEDCLNILFVALQNNYCETAKWFVDRKIYDEKTKLLSMKKGYTHLMEQMMK
ncbi:MAG: ankyrin repeat domain-containing protein [Elusimicrobiaceae bacterium]|nr:ankyrin repeat domain-containing protein [Elusimicrobiaceae bacterium]